MLIPYMVENYLCSISNEKKFKMFFDSPFFSIFFMFSALIVSNLTNC